MHAVRQLGGHYSDVGGWMATPQEALAWRNGPARLQNPPLSGACHTANPLWHPAAQVPPHRLHRDYRIPAHRDRGLPHRLGFPLGLPAMADALVGVHKLGTSCLSPLPWGSRINVHRCDNSTWYECITICIIPIFLRLVNHLPVFDMKISGPLIIQQYLGGICSRLLLNQESSCEADINPQRSRPITARLKVCNWDPVIACCLI